MATRIPSNPWQEQRTPQSFFEKMKADQMAAAQQNQQQTVEQRVQAILNAFQERSTRPTVRLSNDPITGSGGNNMPVSGPTIIGTRKFKDGDIVKLTQKHGSADIGVQAKVVGYDSNMSCYILDFTGHNPAWNSQAKGVPTSKLELVTAPIKARKKIDFASVVIEDSKRNQILEALEQINQQDLIFDKWGFGDTIEKGRGISLLFYGEPGTGKTLMGQAIADKLDRKLKVIATADIESSTPGEAERNIRKYFTEATEKDILLFDECDSLIYSRSSVGAILGAQINELLTNLEKFEGITIFTTNRLGTLDEAVNRRLALKLEFAMPKRAERVEIWKRMIPKKAPIADDVNWDKLAVVEVTGGYIKNAVLRAARMAATEKKGDKHKKITHAHFVKAIELEATSMIEFQKATDKHKNRTVGVARPHDHGVEDMGRRVIEERSNVGSTHS